jgi:hypothetical protein
MSTPYYHLIEQFARIAVIDEIIETLLWDKDVTGSLGGPWRPARRVGRCSTSAPDRPSSGGRSCRRRRGR